MNVNPQDFDYIRKLVYDKSAIVLEAGKEYLVESRVLPLVQKEGLNSIRELVQKLQKVNNHELVEEVVDALTTNETSFFRDFFPFEAMREKVIPELLEKRQNIREINLWCAASASGQEPYSVAILLRENFPQLAGWKIHFMASDISREMLDRCRNGRFSQLEINRGLSAVLMVKYFQRHGSEWEVKPVIRDMIYFTKINLSEPFPFMPDMDIVFIRNVLIYFDVPMKIEILKKVRKVLRPDGYVFLGGAETTLNLDSAFDRLDYKQSGCYLLNTED